MRLELGIHACSLDLHKVLHIYIILTTLEVVSRVVKVQF